MDDDRIDFSALDPKADPARFAALVDGVTRRARERRSGSVDVQIRRWHRPALAAAAACAAIVWSAALLARPTSEAPVAASDAAYTMLAWAADDATPPAAAILTTLGGTP